MLVMILYVVVIGMVGGEGGSGGLNIRRSIKWSAKTIES